MPICYLHTTSPRPRFYRVEIAANLFGEWSVLREWGVCGRRGSQRIALFSDLRTASKAADRARNRMLRRGYQRG